MARSKQKSVDAVALMCFVIGPGDEPGKTDQLNTGEKVTLTEYDFIRLESQGRVAKVDKESLARAKDIASRQGPAVAEAEAKKAAEAKAKKAAEAKAKKASEAK